MRRRLGRLESRRAREATVQARNGEARGMSRVIGACHDLDDRVRSERLWNASTLVD